MEKVKLIECPRDAMQGIHELIPTDVKAIYLNQLLKVGYDTLDFGSFVSPKAIPQMKDTAHVLARLNLDDTETKLLSIVVNERGALQASNFDEIDYLGYPFSISETFQMRNSKKTIEDSIELVDTLLNLCEINGKELVVYTSMAWGNPYGDAYDIAILEHWVDRLVEAGVEIISLSDTIGIAAPEKIAQAFDIMTNHFPKTEFGAHLHTTPESWEEKVSAAYEYGCRRFDGALKGYGGCPMAKDDLVGNMPTEKIIEYLQSEKVPLDIDEAELKESLFLAGKVFI